MISPPRWCKDAEPTTKGWVKNGELLVSRRISQDEIDEYLNVAAYGASPVVEEVVVEEVVHEEPTMLHEAPVGHKSLEDMTKKELLALGEQNGISLSRFSTKGKLIEKLESEL